MKAETRQYRFSLGTAAIIMACLAVFVLATTGWSQDSQNAGQQSEKKQAVQKPQTTLSVSGQKAAIDPQTKKLRQLTPEEAEALSEEIKNFIPATPGEPKIYQFRNGMLAVELPEEYMDSVVVKRNPDGTLSMECVKGLKAAMDRTQVQTKNPAESRQGVTNSDKPTSKPNLEEK